MIIQKYDSPLGHLYLIFKEEKLCRLIFGSQNFGSDCRKNPILLKSEISTRWPSGLKNVKVQLDEYFKGKRDTFCIGLDLDEVPPFRKKVLDHLINEVTFGRICTYGDIARKINSKGYQAVGSAVGKNPIPIIIPCHRVFSKLGPGGFTAPNGLETKAKLLKIESIDLLSPGGKSYFDENIDLKKIKSELIKTSSKFREVIFKMPCYSTGMEKETDPYQSLIRAIIFQQLTTKAASTIYARFKKRFYKGRRVNQDLIIESPLDYLREVGVSLPKAKAIQGLTHAKLRGEIPTLKEARRLPSSELINRLVALKGIGPWTVQMYLIFGLGRLDIFAPADLALRRGVEFVLSKKEISEKEAELLATRWAPYRSVASWYLWRLTDM